MHQGVTFHASAVAHLDFAGQCNCGFAKVPWGRSGECVLVGDEETLSTTVQCGDGSDRVMLQSLRRPRLRICNNHWQSLPLATQRRFSHRPSFGMTEGEVMPGQEPSAESQHLLPLL